jgi:DNA-binding cell septation regulator SpoVG
MDIKIHRLCRYNSPNNPVKAFVDLIIDDELVVKGWKLVEGKEGLFLGNPRERSKNNTYFDTVRFETLTRKNEVEKMVVDFYLDNKQGPTKKDDTDAVHTEEG